MQFNRQRVFRSLLIGAMFLASAVVGLVLGSRFFGSRLSGKPAEIEPAALSRPFLQTKAELCANYGKPAAFKAQKLKEAQGLSFQSGTTNISAEFLGDDCHYIRYAMPQPWSGEQIKKILLQNGCSWIIPSTNGGGWTPLTDAKPPRQNQQVEYDSKEGHHAKYTGVTHWLEVWSCKPVIKREEPPQIQKPPQSKRPPQVQ